MAHQLGEDIDRRAVVGVALGVAVTKRVRDHAFTHDRVTVAVNEVVQRADPAMQDTIQRAGREREPAVGVAEHARQQHPLRGGRVGELLGDPALLLDDGAGRRVIDRQATAPSRDLRHVVNEHRQARRRAVLAAGALS